MDTEPDVKKKKALPRISSLSTMMATPLGRRVEKMGSALQKSLSVARLSPAGSMRTPSKASLARSASTVFGEKEEEKGSGRTSPGSQSLSEPQGWASSPFRRSSVHLTRKNSGANLTPYKPPLCLNPPTALAALFKITALHSLSSSVHRSKSVCTAFSLFSVISLVWKQCRPR